MAILFSNEILNSVKHELENAKHFESGELYVSDEEMEMMNTSKISSINI